ncbi:MAG: hypothetical protein ACFN9G_06175, partial [Cardiobacterium sp.]
HRVRLGAPHTVQDIRAATNGRHLGTVDTLAQNVSLPNIAVHRKFQTRRVAEDGTHLYGEATQHSMRLSVDGYTPPSHYLEKSPPPVGQSPHLLQHPAFSLG